VSWLYKKYGSLYVSQTYRSPWPVIGIALLFPTLFQRAQTQSSYFFSAKSEDILIQVVIWLLNWEKLFCYLQTVKSKPSVSIDWSQQEALAMRSVPDWPTLRRLVSPMDVTPYSLVSFQLLRGNLLVYEYVRLQSPRASETGKEEDRNRKQSYSQVIIILLPAVSRPVCLGFRNSSGACDKCFFFLIIFRQMRVCWCGAPFMTRGLVCSLQILLSLASSVFLGS
jgi:hypothetical protein